MEVPQQTTISQCKFAEICATARASTGDTLRQLGNRRVSPGDVVRSAIMKEIYQYFAVQPNRLDRVHDMRKIDDVMAGRMELPFDYAAIVNRCTKQAEQQYGNEPSSRKSRRPAIIDRGSPRGGAKQDFRRKRV
jgi:hypothetical protein